MDWYRCFRSEFWVLNLVDFVSIYDVINVYLCCLSSLVKYWFLFTYFKLIRISFIKKLISKKVLHLVKHLLISPPKAFVSKLVYNSSFICSNNTDETSLPTNNIYPDSGVMFALIWGNFNSKFCAIFEVSRLFYKVYKEFNYIVLCFGGYNCLYFKNK